MDENISYDRAWEAVDTSLRLQDVSTLRDILQRFPVLQLHAGRQLIQNIATCSLTKASERSGLVRTTVDAIGCIASPCGLLTAECKICATTLFYGIRNFDEGFLQMIVKRMIVAKRDCAGCGLFVHVAMSEILNQVGRLPDFVKQLFQLDDAEQFEIDIHSSWKKVLDTLRREGVVKGTQRSPASKQRASSLIGTKEIRRLHLRMEGGNDIYKRRKRKVVTSFRTTPVVLESKKEQELLLKLVTMYTACPKFVADKIRNHGLKSYCSAKLLSLHDSLVRSRQRRFTEDELRGIKVIGTSKFDPSPDKVLMSINNDSSSREILAGGTERSENGCSYDGELANLTNGALKVWMPLALGVENFLQGVWKGKTSLDSIVGIWTSAKGSLVSSMDQIVVAGLADDYVLEDVIGRWLSRERCANATAQVNHLSNTMSTLTECFRMLDIASKRGSGYPTCVWEHLMKVFVTLESAFVTLVLQDTHDSWRTEVGRVIRHSKNIEERLQGRVEYRKTEAKKNVAVLKICDCLAVEMKWKDGRRVRRSVWRGCRCMIPNTMFMPMPKPSLWFCWMGHTSHEARVVEGAKTASRWLYTNGGWRNRQYCFSRVEILDGIIGNMLCDGVVLSEVSDILQYVLKDGMVQKQFFTVLTKRVKTVISQMMKKDTLERVVRTVRRGVEKVWSNVGHAKHGVFDKDSAIASEELARMEELLKIVVSSSMDVDECLRDMPAFCDFVGTMYAMLCDGLRVDCVYVKMVGGLVCSRVRGKAHPLVEDVMTCFE